MIEYTKGNLLDAQAEALVNTVNEVGVMGKGIALMFKERFPDASRGYMEASKAGTVRVGEVFVTPSEELFPKWIIHFPTKRHWRHRSKIEWVRTGLVDLVRVVRELQITSIAIPPLGCGNGGLAWSSVRPLIEEAFAPLRGVDVLIFEPTVAYQNEPKMKGAQALTPARALVSELVRRYSVLGLDCTLLEVQKLAYFLQAQIHTLDLPDPLKLRFGANRYGPYADRLRHLLNAVEGSYLRSLKRINDAAALDRIWFVEEKREAVGNYLVSEAGHYSAALGATEKLINGFESPLGLELLSTVHWLLDRNGVQPNVPSLKQGLADWPGGEGAGERKLAIFDDRMLQLALARLAPMSSEGNPTTVASSG